MTSINIEALTKQYIELRDTKKQMEEILKQRLLVVKDKMDFIEQEILHFFNSTGQTSAKTKYGTPYIKTARSVTVNDSNEFFKFVKENDAFDLLQKRISSTAFDQYVEDGITVPGVAVSSILKVNIKKS